MVMDHLVIQRTDTFGCTVLDFSGAFCSFTPQVSGSLLWEPQATMQPAQGREEECDGTGRSAHIGL